jgi:predicted metal-binding membrane protein
VSAATTTTPTGRASVHQARRQAATTIALLATVAWVTLVGWDLSPHGRYLDHDELADAGLGATATAGVFVGGWVLMLAAMMFPSTYSLVAVFTPLAEKRGARRALVATLLGGYVAAWTCAGLALLLADAVVHAAVDASSWLTDHPQIIAAATLAVAGAFQFSALKDRCLTVCRSPRTFLFTRWKGRRPGLEAFVLGVEHGRFCIGCCVGLMLVAFGIGAGNLGLMLAFGALMATEKLAPWGARTVAPTGLALLVAAFVVLVAPL